MRDEWNKAAGMRGNETVNTLIPISHQTVTIA